MTSPSVVRPIIKKFSDIKPEKLEWLWKDRIPLGKVTQLVGDPGTGKTVLAVDMAAHVSAGLPWPDLPDEPVELGSVVILTAEDDLGDTVRVRLEAAGADLDKVVTVDAAEIISEGEKTREMGLFDLAKHLRILEMAIAEIHDVQLVIIDPITAYMGGKNSNSNTEVREFLAPLGKLAAKHDLAVVGISHMNKDSHKQAAYRTLGSIAFTAAARVVWFVLEDPEDEDRRLFLWGKGNLSKKPTGLAYRLVGAQVDTDKGPAEAVRVEFEPGVIHETVDEILAEGNKKQKGPGKLEQAVDWLKKTLSRGPKIASETVKEAEQAGIAGRTLDRAKDELGIEPRAVHKDGRIISWLWELPKKEDQSAKGP